MIKINFVRHATTELNGKGYIATKQNFHLNQNGIDDCMVHRYGEGTFDNVYCSPYFRTIETAKLLYPYKTPIVSSLIVQRDLGVLNEHFKNEFTSDYVEKIRDYIINPKCAETLDNLIKRLKVFLDLVNEENSPDSNILVVTHNGIIRILKKEFFYNTNYEETTNLSGFCLKLEKKR